MAERPDLDEARQLAARLASFDDVALNAEGRIIVLLSQALDEATAALRPFAHHALAGDSSHDDRERTIRVTVGQLAQAWHVLEEGST